MKRVVPLHDDLFDFIYQAMPGYEEVGRRRVLLGCWVHQDPDVCNFQYKDIDGVGPGDGRHARCRRRRQARHQRPRRRSTSASASCSVSSFYDDWEDQPMFVTQGPAREPGRSAASVEPDHSAQAPGPELRRQLHVGDVPAVVRWHRSTSRWTPAADPSPALWSTALSDLVDTPHVKATGDRRTIRLPRTAHRPRYHLRVEDPDVVERLERDRARTYFQAYSAAMALHFVERALADVHAGRRETWEPFTVPDEAIGCGFHEAVRGVLSHHLVIRDGKIANYHPYPPTPWNATPRDSFGVPGPYEDAVRHPAVRGERARRRSRASTSCEPCAASIRACRVACTCTWARARSSTPRTPHPGRPPRVGRRAGVDE